MKSSWIAKALALIFTFGFASFASAQSFVVATMMCDNLNEISDVELVEIPVLSIGSESSLIGEIWITTTDGDKIFTGYTTEFPQNSLGIDRYAQYERFEGSLSFEREQLGLRDGLSFRLVQTAHVRFSGEAREAEPAFQLNADESDFANEGNASINWIEEDLSELSCYLISPYPVWGDHL